ncbi:MAG: hypothetical protein ACRD2I_11460 [Vicinamibacterales bacterium]
MRPTVVTPSPGFISIAVNDVVRSADFQRTPGSQDPANETLRRC